jgi:hypothetical protein
MIDAQSMRNVLQSWVSHNLSVADTGRDKGNTFYQRRTPQTSGIFFLAAEPIQISNDRLSDV